MNTITQFGLPTVSVEAFANVMSQIPKGKITTISDLLLFFEKAYDGQTMYLDLPSYIQHPLQNAIPWWRIVGDEGEILDGIPSFMEEQDRFLKQHLAS